MDVSVWKVSVFGVFLVRIFPHSYWIRRDTEYLFAFSPNAGKYGPEKLLIRTLFTHCVSVENNIAISFAPNTVMLKRKQTAMWSNWSYLQMQVYRSHSDIRGKLPIRKKNSTLGLTENSFFQGQHHVCHIWYISLSLSNLSLVAVSFLSYFVFVLQ